MSDDVPISNGATLANGGAAIGVGGSIGFGGGAGASTNPCTLYGNNTAPAIFSDQAVSFLAPARKEVYALVTDAEAKALREGAGLVTAAPSSAPSTVLGTILQSLRSSPSEPRRELGEVLVARFRGFRSAWPNPWALRLVNHPGTEHMNALRVVLRDEAWLVRLWQGAPYVVDLNNANVPIEAALAEPERIAAIYYQVDNNQPVGGITDRCENGLREIALGSEAMVEEWSLGTDAIRGRLDGDIALLLELFEVSRQCAGVGAGTFRSTTVCSTWQSFSPGTEYLAYQWSLATPVESYKPTPQNLASLIQALQDDRLAADPFFVKPAPPPDLGQGSGGEGGGSNDDVDGQGGAF